MPKIKYRPPFWSVLSPDHCWIIMPVNVEQLRQQCLDNCASNVWTIVPATVEEWYHWLLSNPANNCWTLVPVPAEELCQWLLKNHAKDSWKILPVTIEELHQWLLKNCCRDSWRIVEKTVTGMIVRQALAQLFNGHRQSFPFFYAGRILLQYVHCWRIVPCTKNTTHDPDVTFDSFCM